MSGLSLRLEVTRQHKLTRYAFDILTGTGPRWTKGSSRLSCATPRPSSRDTWWMRPTNAPFLLKVDDTERVVYALNAQVIKEPS